MGDTGFYPPMFQGGRVGLQNRLGRFDSYGGCYETNILLQTGYRYPVLDVAGVAVSVH